MSGTSASTTYKQHRIVVRFNKTTAEYEYDIYKPKNRLRDCDEGFATLEEATTAARVWIDKREKEETE